MGIIITEQYFDFTECSLSNVYAAFSNNDIKVKPDGGSGMYCIWISHESRLSNGNPIWANTIPLSSSVTTDVYGTAYEKLKEIYPNSIDC